MDNWLRLRNSDYYSIPAKSHACGLKTAISCIKDNFSRLTQKSGRVVLKKLHFISDLLCIISLPFITIAKAFKCLQCVWILSVQRSSNIFGHSRQRSEVFVKSSEIFGSGSDVFGNPAHDEAKMSRIWPRKSWQVYYSRYHWCKHH